MTTRAEKLAEIERMIATTHNLLAVGLGPENNAEAEARLAVLEAIAGDYRRPEVEPGPLNSRIRTILEAQQVDIVEEASEGSSGFEYRILGIATTAEKIMEAVGELAQADWGKACEALSEACLSKRDALPPDQERYYGRRMGLEDAARLARSLRRPDAAPARKRPSVEDIARAFHLGMNARRDDDWNAVETRDVWLDGARAVLTLLEGKSPIAFCR